MKSNQYHKLPFEDGDFNYDKFEGFVNALLGCGFSMSIGLNEKLHLENLKTTARYGKQGDKQRGIDIIAQTVGGKKFVFQCKYHESKSTKVGLTVARKAVELAHEKYQKADEYVLVTNTSFTPDANDYCLEQGWIMMGSDQLHQAVRSLTSEVGYHLVNDTFGKIAADHFYPLGPHLLISPKKYKSYQTGALSHQYACIGREREIKEIVRKLTTKKPSCVVVSAEGGIGKSRLMCEVLERIERKSEKHFVKILQSDSSGDAKQINLADNYDLHVIAIDDAHIESHLRSDVLKSLAEVKGHLLLMTRPEGVIAIRNTLSKTGWEFPDDNFIKLENLKKPDLIKLASEVVNDSESRMQEIVSLVENSGGNALFTVVGAQLINKGHRFRDIVNHQDFRNKVFNALEANFVSNLNSESVELQKKVIRTMRVIALFSPVTQATLGKLGEFLGLDQFELDDHLEHLSQAGLLRRTDKNVRIIPDLFADFIVMKLVTDSENQSIINQLKRINLIELVGPDVFKNLALAEWLLRQENKPSLLEPFWEGYKTAFEEKSWHEIGKELKNWSSFSFYLPEESIELAELVLQSKKEECFYGSSTAYVSAYELIVTVCNHSLKYQGQALDLIFKYLFSSSHQLGFSDGNTNHPLQSVFHIKSDTKYSAINWLNSRLDDDKFISSWISKRNNWIELSINGIFAKVADDTFWIGNTIHFGTGLVIYENTKELREKAFIIIRKLAFKTVEGALNIIKTLEFGARGVSGMHGYIDDDKLQKEWLPFRILCIEMLGELAQYWTNPIVHFEARKSLRQLYWVNEPLPEFQNRRIQILESIPNSLELDLLTMMLSNGYQEFKSLVDEESENLWNEFIEISTKELLEIYEVKSLFEYIDEIISKIQSCGYSPSIGHLLSGISKFKPELIECMRERALAGDQLYSDYYLSLAYWFRDSCSEEEKDQMLLDGFKKIGSILLPNLLHILADDKNANNLGMTNEAVISYLQQVKGIEMDQILDLLRNLWSHNLKKLVYENFNYSGLSAEHIYRISESLVNYSYKYIEYPNGFLVKVMEQMKKIPNVERTQASALLLKVSFDDPKLVYDLIKNDVMKAVSDGDRDKYGKAFPYQLLEMRFHNKNEIPNEEIGGVFNAYLLAEDKSLYRFWLKVVMSANHELSNQLFMKRLELISKENELNEFLRYESWIDRLSLFHDHQIIKAILCKASEISIKCLKSNIQNLAYTSTNTMHSYTNGERENIEILNKALEYSEQVRGDDLLSKFYDTVVKVEREDLERHREEYKRQMQAMDEF